MLACASFFTRTPAKEIRRHGQTEPEGRTTRTDPGRLRSVPGALWLGGASLERVGEEAGLARALIRHNVGNRDQLIDAFVADFLDRSRSDTAALVSGLPKAGRVARLIDDLFDPGHEDAASAAIGSALLAAVDLHSGLKAAMATWNDDFVGALAAVLSADSNADEQSIRHVAAGLSALYANVEAMAAIDQNGNLRADSRAAARRLAATLPGLEDLRDA